MAIYREGKADLAADGTVTGTDTKWRSSLSLIRPGATMIFLSSPIQIAVVNKVISDTEIKAITTNGAVVASSDYAILLSDSLTVDGLAQDVAETLRYYQSQETAVAEAVEFFNDFDFEALQNLANQIKSDSEAAESSAASAAASQNAAKTSETNAMASEVAAETARDQVQQIINDAGEQSTLVVLSQPTGAGKSGLLQGGTVQDVLKYVTPEIFYQTTDLNNDGLMIQRMFNYMLEHGVEGRLSAGREYIISSNISVTLNEGDHFKLSFDGARLLQSGNTDVITIQNGKVGNITAVSSIEVVQRNLGDGAATTRVVKVTSPNHPFTEKYQVGKIFSDDVVPDAENTDQLCGEFFIVGEVEDANTFYTTGIFDENYLTNIKVVRPAINTTIIDGPLLESQWSDEITSSFMTLRGLIQPSIKGVSAKDLNGPGINITSCLQAEIDGVAGNRIKNEPSLGAYGYLVNDSGSEQTTVNGIRCVFSRHAFTTTQPRATAGDDRWDLRGRSKDFVVKDGMAKGCDVAFDTHATAIRGKFINLTTSDDKRGNTAGGAGIQIRGNGMEVIDCNVSHSKVGLFVSGATKTSPSKTTIRNLVYNKGPQSHIPIIISGSNTYASEVFIDGCDIETENDLAIQITNANVYITGGRSFFNPYQNSGALVELNEGACIEYKGRVAFGGDSSLGRLVRHKATGTKAKFDVDISGVSGRLSYFMESASQYDVVSRYITRQDAALPGIPFLGYASTSPKISAEITVNDVTRPLGYRDITYSAAGNNTLNLQFAGDQSIFARIAATISGVVINGVTQGAFPGQRLIINNRNTSASTLRVENNIAGLLNLVSGVDIPVGQGITLMWDGSFWRYGCMI